MAACNPSLCLARPRCGGRSAPPPLPVPRVVVPSLQPAHSRKLSCTSRHTLEGAAVLRRRFLVDAGVSASVYAHIGQESGVLVKRIDGPALRLASSLAPGVHQDAGCGNSKLHPKMHKQAAAWMPHRSFAQEEQRTAILGEARSAVMDEVHESSGGDSCRTLLRVVQQRRGSGRRRREEDREESEGRPPLLDRIRTLGPDSHATCITHSRVLSSAGEGNAADKDVFSACERSLGRKKEPSFAGEANLTWKAPSSAREGTTTGKELPSPREASLAMKQSSVPHEGSVDLSLSREWSEAGGRSAGRRGSSAKRPPRRGNALSASEFGGSFRERGSRQGREGGVCSSILGERPVTSNPSKREERAGSRQSERPKGYESGYRTLRRPATTAVTRRPGVGLEGGSEVSRRRTEGECFDYRSTSERGRAQRRLGRDLYLEAALALFNADFLLVCAGAGFSADSGLATYKDVADVDAYRERDLEYSDLCVPKLAFDAPETFFGFWGSCFNSYHSSKPHDGYAIIAKWRDCIVGNTSKSPRLFSCEGEEGEGERMSCDEEWEVDRRTRASASFVYTSNVDCFFRRSGWDESSILEIHGAKDFSNLLVADSLRCFTYQSSCTTADHASHMPLNTPMANLLKPESNISRWQCSLPCPASRAACCGPSKDHRPVWTLPHSHRFQVDPTTMLAPPLKPGRNHSGGMESNFQRCHFCGRIARPCILMFNDSAWLGEIAPGPAGGDHSQARSYEMWERRVKSELRSDPTKRLVILEAGCGLRVPTVRQHSQQLLRQTLKYGTRLIRINPEAPFNRKCQEATISLKDTCLAAVRRIDSHLAALCAKNHINMPVTD